MCLRLLLYTRSNVLKVMDVAGFEAQAGKPKPPETHVSLTELECVMRLQLVAAMKIPDAQFAWIVTTTI
jgi:hypothetical protein